ncbi:MAG: phosphatase PAP2 family protein [Sedimentisphaerales bacterium]|nr:phosphatase PAP2 family protein [Sedimentisphaerales bacterium]
MSYTRQLILYLACLAGVIGLFEFTGADLAVQDCFYIQDLGCWIVDRHEPVLRLLFYTGPKAMLIALGAGCFAGWLWSRRDERLRRQGRQCLLLALSLAVVPLTISGLKSLSNVQTPNKTERYGGRHPYRHLLEAYPEGAAPASRGRGWPAGHASGGFALMMLYFVFSRKSTRSLGLLMGLAAGWIMGLYQSLNGQHFLSHTMITMLIAWIVILSIHRLLKGIGAPVDDSTAAPYSSSGGLDRWGMPPIRNDTTMLVHKDVT